MTKSIYTGAIIAVLASVFATAPASAHFSGKGIDKRQQRQAELIEAGRVTGLITWREGRALRREQRQIADLEANYRSDGHISTSERRELHQALTDARRHIDAEMNDAQRRPWFLIRVGR